MGETQTAAGVQDPEYNPFDPAHHKEGGGLWDGKTVTITSAQTKTEALKNGDGSPVIDKETKQPVIQTALYLTGISDGSESDKERHEEYTAGGKNVATPDGEGFVDGATGGLATFSKSSNLSKFLAALKGSGFDIGTLIERGPDGKIIQRLRRLTGARFVFKGEPKIGRDGKPLKDKKGYTKTSHLPVKFVGYATGAPSSGGSNGAGGAAVPVAPSTSALETKAVGAVTAILAKTPGEKVTRANLMRALAASLQGDADANSIIGLVVRDDFHKGKPWSYDAIAGASL
jgi:hypothetical protein